MAIFNNTTINDTGYLQLPVGTTEQRPLNPTKGMMRYNTTTSKYEHFDGTSWKNWVLSDYEDFFQFYTDTAGTTNVVGFSLRRLSPNYTGACLEVRRSSDNATATIGFVNNRVDTATLTSFSNGGNVHVTRIYNQLTNTSKYPYLENIYANQQPLIVENGVVVIFNNNPAIKFYRNSFNYMWTSGSPTVDTMREGFIVGGFHLMNSVQYISSLSNADSRGNVYDPTNNTLTMSVIATGTGSSTAKSLTIGVNEPFIMLHYHSTRYKGYYNNVDLGNLYSSTSTASERRFIIGTTRTASNLYSDLYWQETVQHYGSSNKSEEVLQNIRNQVNTFYNLY